SLAILFIPSREPVQIPETTHADGATPSAILTPPQTTAIELPRFTLPMIATEQAPVSDEVSTMLEWTWRMASMALALVILASGVLCRGNDGAGSAVIWPGLPSTYRRIAVLPLSGFFVRISSCRGG